MLPVFRDAHLQAQFEQTGYVVIPFYDEKQISHLNQFYRQYHPVDEEGFYASTYSRNKAYRAGADQEIRRVAAAAIEKNFQDIRVVAGSFIVKSPSPNSAMGVHQDMTLVDESQFTGINIWCPLVDLTPHNGVLKVLPGSHRIRPTYRGASIPDFYRKVRSEILRYGQPIYLKAGQAIVFDQSIIHFSPPNLSAESRIVTNIFFTHQDARFQIAYYHEDMVEKAVELFAQNDRFIVDFDQFGHDIKQRPTLGESLGEVPYDFPELTLQQLEERYGKLPQLTPDRQPSWWRRLVQAVAGSTKNQDHE